MTTILKITEDDFESAVDIASTFLKSGGTIIYPTDTVYGIGGDATSGIVVKEILKIKKIKEPRPLSIMVSDASMVEYYCETGIWEDMILNKYLPGPYTFILKKRRPLPASQTEKIGVRYPESVFCQALCRKFGRPIITTSANISGNDSPVTFDQIDKKILNNVKIAIDGGPTKYQAASLIVDLVDRTVLRSGGEAISLIELPEY
ncbi:threonylcarbamoyl-AMP synthase [Candidatus Micrarchaeota archaeon]|nr:threonylcarbamoyl-AMP synthase [Candidatus Micrarchaeota archaeon]